MPPFCNDPVMRYVKPCSDFHLAQEMTLRHPHLFASFVTLVPVLVTIFVAVAGYLYLRLLVQQELAKVHYKGGSDAS